MGGARITESAPEEHLVNHCERPRECGIAGGRAECAIEGLWDLSRAGRGGSGVLCDRVLLTLLG